MEVAILGLGDSSYDKFNAAARMLGVRMSQLGAGELCARGLADDQSEQGLEGDLDIWLKSQLWPALLKRLPAEARPAGLINDAPAIAGTRYTVNRTSESVPAESVTSVTNGPMLAPRYFPGFLQAPQQAYPVESTGAIAPMLAHLVSNERVTAPAWS